MIVKEKEMKRVLFVHPNNFLKGGQGENVRVLELLHLFKEIGYEVDLFSFENFTPDSTFLDFADDNSDNKIRELYLYDYANNQMGYKRIQSFYTRLKNKLKRMVKSKVKGEYLQNWVRPGMKQLFEQVIKSGEYDVVAIFYTYLSELLVNLPFTGKKVYFMEDSMFIQQYSWDKGRIPNMTLGKLMDEEIERLKEFDEYFCISYDEKIIYEKITNQKMYFLPHLLPEGNKRVETPVAKRKWDVFFIGFNNPYNVEGLKWFIEEVYPYLDKKLNILLVGSATDCIKKEYDNVTIIRYIPNLEEVYSDVKVAICPMFNGTGMKIKVVESMAKGIPIVCNERGVDGFPDKMMTGCLVTQNPEEFASYINQLNQDTEFYAKRVKKMNDYYMSIFDREHYKKLLESVLG